MTLLSIYLISAFLPHQYHSFSPQKADLPTGLPLLLPFLLMTTPLLCLSVSPLSPVASASLPIALDLHVQPSACLPHLGATATAEASQGQNSVPNILTEKSSYQTSPNQLMALPPFQMQTEKTLEACDSSTLENLISLYLKKKKSRNQVVSISPHPPLWCS